MFYANYCTLHEVLYVQNTSISKQYYILVDFLIGISSMALEKRHRYLMDKHGKSYA